MALVNYRIATLNLLQVPNSPTLLYPTTSLDLWINTARGQLAGESECIRALGALAITSGTRVYKFSSVDLGTSATTGVGAPLKLNNVWINIAKGSRILTPHPFNYFGQYCLNKVVPESGSPTSWAQYGQGAFGTIYLDPVPDVNSSLFMDCVCRPIDLVDDTTVDAIPYPWTDAIPYFAAYLALLSAQASARQADAARLFGLYTEFMNRARRESTPSVLPSQYDQTPSPVRANQLSMQPVGRGAG